MTLAYSDLTMRAPDRAEWEAYRSRFAARDWPTCCNPRGHNRIRWFVVHRFYLELGWNARKVAALLPDDWTFDQHTIHIYACKVRRACNISEPERAGPKKVDWELAQELLNEGMTDDELRDVFGCARTTIEYSSLHSKRPRRTYIRKRARHGC